MFQVGKILRVLEFFIVQPVPVCGNEGLKKQQGLDERKAALCFEHGVRLFIVRYDEDMDTAVSRTRLEYR